MHDFIKGMLVSATITLLLISIFITIKATIWPLSKIQLAHHNLKSTKYGTMNTASAERAGAGYNQSQKT